MTLFCALRMRLRTPIGSIRRRICESIAQVGVAKALSFRNLTASIWRAFGTGLKIRIHGDLQDLDAHPMSDDQVKDCIKRCLSEAGLEVERERVVNLAVDMKGSQVGPEFVAAGGAEDVLVEDMVGAGVGPGEDQAS